MYIGKCEECGGKLITTSEGAIVCSACGLVSSYLIVNPQYVVGDIYTDSSRPLMYVYRDDISDVYGLGSYVKSNRNEKLLKMRNLDRYIKSAYKNRIERRIMNSLTYAVSKLSLTQIILKRAISIYTKAIKLFEENKNKRDGINKYTIAAASLLLASWEHNRPLTMGEMAFIFKEMGHRVNRKQLAIVISQLKKSLTTITITPEFLIEQYLYRIIGLISMQKYIRMKILKDKKLMRNIDSPEKYFNSILKEAKNLLHSTPVTSRLGKNPYIIAVSLIYTAERAIAQKLDVRQILSQRILSILTGVSEFSIRENSLIFRNGINQKKF